MIKTEGILLQAITFKEADQILTAITTEGLIKLMYKGALSKKRGRGALTAPLQQVEIIYSKGKSEIASCKELSVMNSFGELRGKIEYLESAGEMGAAIIATQQTYAPNPLIYKLFLYYLENVATVDDPYALAASFKLKILRYEGSLAIQPYCTVCRQESETLSIYSGECYCPNHAPVEGVCFSGEEMDFLMLFTYGRSMKMFSGIRIPDFLLRKIRQLFVETCSSS